MRLILSLAVWFILIGGLAAYMHTRDTVEEVREFQQTKAKGVFSIEVSASFEPAPDPFALRPEREEKASTILVHLNGKEILKRTELITSGEPLRVDGVKGLVEGLNEFYIEANPPLQSAVRSHALRVRFFRDGQLIAERSFWSEEGSRIATTFSLKIEREKPAEENHAH